jgi:hypothetical protein
MNTARFAHLIHAVHALGPTDTVRARRLGVSLRTLLDYKRGRFPRIVSALLERPDLVMALAADSHTLLDQHLLLLPPSHDGADSNHA